LGIVLAIAALVGAAEGAEKKPARAKDPAFAPVRDDPKLPRVLLLGDSISIGYTVPVQKLLAGKANVHRAPTNCGPTSRGVVEIDRWLGNGRWDVIHFNFGLHDLKQVDGKHQVPLEDYEKNLRTLVARMKKTGARLIWAATTPVPEGSGNPPRRVEDVVAYNRAARTVMEENDVAIDDLYAFALPRLKEIQRPANVHFTPAGSQALAREVAVSIQQALKNR
jgi:acyl-CoA thioesterase-1